jgi:hypothetical protein
MNWLPAINFEEWVALSRRCLVFLPHVHRNNFTYTLLVHYYFNSILLFDKKSTAGSFDNDRILFGYVTSCHFIRQVEKKNRNPVRDILVLPFYLQPQILPVTYFFIIAYIVSVWQCVCHWTIFRTQHGCTKINSYVSVVSRPIGNK